MEMFLIDVRIPVEYDARFREYSLSLHNGAIQLIDFCPCCGAELPESLHDEFFRQMDNLGIQYPDEQPPPQFSDDRWWREAGL